MRVLADKFSRLAAVFGLALVLLTPQIAYSNTVDEDPSALVMTSDLLLVRPVLFAATVIGTVAYVISLPFSLAGGNAAEAGNTLVVGPAKATFVRCLGCTNSGYKNNP